MEKEKKEKNTTRHERHGKAPRFFFTPCSPPPPPALAGGFSFHTPPTHPLRAQSSELRSTTSQLLLRRTRGAGSGFGGGKVVVAVVKVVKAVKVVKVIGRRHDSARPKSRAAWRCSRRTFQGRPRCTWWSPASPPRGRSCTGGWPAPPPSHQPPPWPPTRLVRCRA